MRWKSKIGSLLATTRSRPIYDRAEAERYLASREASRVRMEQCRRHL